MGTIDTYGGGTWTNSVYGGAVTISDSGSRTDTAVAPPVGLISATTTDLGTQTDTAVASLIGREILTRTDAGTLTSAAVNSKTASTTRRLLDAATPTDTALSSSVATLSASTTDAGSVTATSVKPDTLSELGRAFDGSPDPVPFGAGSWASGAYGGAFQTRTGISVGPTAGDITATTFDLGSQTDTAVRSDTAAGFARTFDEGTTTPLSLSPVEVTVTGRVVNDGERTDISAAPRVASAVSVADVIRFVALVGEVRQARAVPGERDATQEFATSDEDDNN